MERHCGNCGAVIYEGYKVCGSCGAPADLGTGNTAPQKPKLNFDFKKLGDKKNLIIIGGAAVALIVIIAVIAGVAGNGYKKPIKTFAKAFEESDFDIIWDEVYAEEVSDYLEDSMGTTWEKTREENYESIVEFIEEECGDDYKIKVEYKDKEKYKKDDIEDFVDELDDDYRLEYDADDIKKLYEVEVIITADGDDELELYEGEFYVAKIEGDWRVIWDDLDFTEEDDLADFVAKKAMKDAYSGNYSF